MFLVPWLYLRDMQMLEYPKQDLRIINRLSVALYDAVEGYDAKSIYWYSYGDWKI